MKIIAGYHQFHAVRRAVESTLRTSDVGRVSPPGRNPTLVVLTDRNNLDDQLFITFAICRDLIRQTPIQAYDREHLRELLCQLR